MTNLVSIIIPTRNRPEWLADAIRSSQDQSYQLLEIIVVDDGSDPNVNQHLLKQFPTVRYIYQEHSGAGAARNTGIKASAGQFIQFLDDDDWLAADAIQTKLAVLLSIPDAKMVYSDIYLTDQDGNITEKFLKHINRPLPSGDLYGVLIEHNFIPIHSLLWRKGILEDIGGFQGLAGHEDWELLLRAAELGLFAAIDKPLGYYRNHSHSLAHDFESMYKGKLVIQSLVVGSSRFRMLPTAQRVRLLTRYAYQQWALGDPNLATRFLSEARREAPQAILPVLLRIFMLLGRPAARALIKLRAWAWKTLGR
jgi:glycosyltransferase involved in cell wall biosynthesis